jgi:hypothetical protein
MRLTEPGKIQLKLAQKIGSKAISSKKGLMHSKTSKVQNTSRLSCGRKYSEGNAIQRRYKSKNDSTSLAIISSD